MPSFRWFAMCLLTSSILAPAGLNAQAPGRDPERKTIEISATEKVRVVSDVASIKLGFQNEAATKDTAYTENIKIADNILRALLAAGVPKEAIETETVNLGQESDRYSPAPRQAPKFTANQRWLIHSKASEAQKIVDVAVAAGANQIEQVEWSASDEKQLEAKAYAAALKRAKELAEQTASQTGLKLGEILSIANESNSIGRQGRFGDRESMYAVEVSAAPPPAPMMLKLQPGFVEREASVTITYAVAP